MSDSDIKDVWARKKSGLKRSFGLWAMRHEDVVVALSAWGLVQRGGDKLHDVGFFAFSAFIAAYGRIFTGSDALKGEPWIPPEDVALHKLLMAQRNEAIAHSDARFRTVHLLPPGIDKAGAAFVPAHKVSDWRWCVLAGEIRDNLNRVEPRLRMLQEEFARRASKALDELLEHCRDRVIPVREMTLDEF